MFKKKPKKEKKPKILISTNQKIMRVLWFMLAFSLCFAIYKHFTAIDIHTIETQTVVEKQLVSTNNIENFVMDFSSVYFTWSGADVDSRNASLLNYMTLDLQSVSLSMVRKDIPTVSAVTSTKIWQVNQKNQKEYSVLFEVNQTINGDAIKTSYETTVYVEDNGNMVITKTPTPSTLPIKSDYKPNIIESTGNIDTVITNEINTFLDTFFKLYPTSTVEELNYYVKDNLLKDIDDRFLFEEISKITYQELEDKQTRVYINVNYIDTVTGVTLVSQYDLVLEKIDGNYKVVGVN